MNICPTVFGPYFWSVIHMTCLSAGKNVSDEKRAALEQFVNSLPAILPCSQCGKHLKENLSLLPFDSQDPFRWSVDLHNLVNTQLMKPEIEYDKAYRYWSSRCGGGTRINQSLVILAVFVIFVVFFLIFRR